MGNNNINNLIEENVLCAANNYEQKYYINPRFKGLPETVLKELKIMCVMFTTRIGGVITLYFDETFEDEDASLQIIINHNEEDILYDEIGSGLEVKRLRSDNRELFEQLELFYKTIKELEK